MMSDDAISQEEIDALLNGGLVGGDSSPEPAADTSSAGGDDILSDIEKDALGEIGNISMGSAATTLSVLLGHKVNITTPTVHVDTISVIKNQYPMPYLVVEVGYVIGINGNNILAIQAQDAAIIADLMMGGDGLNPPDELNEIHMSAVGESMNQMMGTVATSLSTVFNMKIDISPPKVNLVDLSSGDRITELMDPEEQVARISFRMEVDGLIDSEIMQVLPLNVAKDMVNFLMGGTPMSTEQEQAPEPAPAPAPTPAPAPAPAPAAPPPPPQQPATDPYGGYPPPPPGGYPPPPGYGAPPPGYGYPPPPSPGSARVGYDTPVSAAQFAPLSTAPPRYANNDNIGLILDVPLQVTVELGRTKKSVKEILEVTTGSIIELDRLAGEPVDIHINGQLLAKGEVVVIDENFGVRITDIVSPAERAMKLR